jgi:hypothetical protein
VVEGVPGDGPPAGDPGPAGPPPGAEPAPGPPGRVAPGPPELPFFPTSPVQPHRPTSRIIPAAAARRSEQRLRIPPKCRGGAPFVSLFQRLRTSMAGCGAMPSVRVTSVSSLVLDTRAVTRGPWSNTMCRLPPWYWYPYTLKNPFTF